MRRCLPLLFPSVLLLGAEPQATVWLEGPWQVTGSPVETTALRAAVLGDLDSLEAALPPATAEILAPTLARRLEEGFRSSGWPQARVEVTAGKAGPQVLVTAGTQVRAGTVVVRGLPATESASLTADLASGWRSGNVADASTASLDQRTTKVRAWCAEHGWMSPKVNVTFGPATTAGVVDLMAEIVTTGPPARWGTITITGIPDTAAVADLLQVQTGGDVGLRAQHRLEQVLEEACRFTRRTVTLTPRGDTGVVDLAIALQPAHGLPPLPTPLTATDAAIVRATIATARLLRGEAEEDAVLTVTMPNVVVEACFGRDGVVAEVRRRIDGHPEAVLDLGMEEMRLWGGASQRGVILPAATAPQMTMTVDVQTTGRESAPGVDEVNVMANLASSSTAVGPRLVRQLHIDPLVAVSLAHRPTALACHLAGEVLSVGDGTSKFQGRWSAVDGRCEMLRWQAAPDTEVLLRARTGPVAAAREALRRRKATWSQGTTDPTISLLTLAAAELTARPAPEGMTVEMWRSAGDLATGLATLLSHVPQNRHEVSTIHFPSTPQGARSMAALFAALRQLTAPLPRTSWPMVLPRSAALVAIGQGMVGLKDLDPLAAADGAGPVGCLVTGLSLKAIYHPAGDTFLDLARQRLDQFDREVELLDPWIATLDPLLEALPNPDLAAVRKAAPDARERVRAAARWWWRTQGRARIATLLGAVGPASF